MIHVGKDNSNNWALGQIYLYRACKPTYSCGAPCSNPHQDGELWIDFFGWHGGPLHTRCWKKLGWGSSMVNTVLILTSYKPISKTFPQFHRTWLAHDMSPHPIRSKPRGEAFQSRWWQHMAALTGTHRCQKPGFEEDCMHGRLVRVIETWLDTWKHRPAGFRGQRSNQKWTHVMGFMGDMMRWAWNIPI